MKTNLKLTCAALCAVLLVLAGCDAAFAPVNQQVNDIVDRGSDTANSMRAGSAIKVPFVSYEILPALDTTSRGTARLEPATFSVQLAEGKSASESLTANMPASVIPKKGDILMAFDLTGSMSGVVSTATGNAQHIMNNIRALISDSRFGVVSHKDYPVAPYGGTGDYPYRLDAPITANDSTITTAMAGFVVGGGGDFPESYSRVFYEAYTDATIGWRNGAKKFLIIWLDATPHAKDPGPDGVPNTADDLTIDQVLDGLKANNITLITLCSQERLLPIWKSYSNVTGGDAFAITSNTAIADFIAARITEQTKKIDRLTLEVAEPQYQSWLTTLAPAQHGGIVLDSDKTFNFDATYTVPAGTPDGEYAFTLNLVGDGALYAEHKVNITVKNNKPPVADAGDDITVEQTAPAGALVALSGARSYDPEGDAITYRWTWAGGSSDKKDFSHTFPAGSTEVTLTVTETATGRTSVDAVRVTVRDTVAPSFTITRTHFWWLFDNRFRLVARIHASDAGTTQPVVTASGMQEFPDGTREPVPVKVLANKELYIQFLKDGKSVKRNFYITITVTDSAGNSVSSEEIFRTFP